MRSKLHQGMLSPLNAISLTRWFLWLAVFRGFASSFGDSRDPDSSVGEVGSDFELPSHGLDEIIQGADIRDCPALHLRDGRLIPVGESRKVFPATFLYGILIFLIEALRC